MGSKVSWILAAFLLAALGTTGFFLNQAKTERDEAVRAKKTADEAAAKAITARQKAESLTLETDAGKKQIESELSNVRTELTVAKQKVEETKSQTPRLEAEINAVRKSLAEAQRQTLTGGQPAAPAAPKVIPRRAEGGWSVPELLPPDTLSLITIRDVPVIQAKLKETSLWKILTSPDFERVFRKPLTQARGAMFAGEVFLQERLADLGAFLSQGEISFALLGVDKRLPNGQPLPDMMLSVQLRDKAEAFVLEFNKRLDQLKIAAGGRLQVSTSKLGNTTVTRLKFADVPVEVSCGLCDGTFLLCLGEGRLEKLLAMREKMKGNPKADENTPEVLAQVSAYKKALEKAGADADLITFVNVEALLHNPIVNDPNREMTPTQKHELEMSGLLEVKAFSYSATLRDAGVREALFLDVPAPKRKGALALLDGETVDLTAFGAAPRNSILAWTFKVNPEMLFEKILAMAEMENQQARENMAAVLFMIGNELKLDPKKDILGALSGQATFALSIPTKNAKLPLAFPQPVLALQIKDKDSFKRLTSALMLAAQDRFEFKDAPEGNATITVARDRDPIQGQLNQFCFTVAGDDLLLSIYPLALREELQRRAVKGNRLDDDPNFNLARANVSGQAQTMVYVDTGALAVAAYDLLMPLAQMQGQNQVPQLDLAALPTADLLNRNLGGSLVNLQFTPDGIVVEGYSPGGVVSLALPMAALGVRLGQQAQTPLFDAAGAPPGPIAPMRRAAARARRAGRADPKQVAALEKLYRDLKEYAQEHEGNFPKTLEEMKPKYLQDLGNQIEQIVYLGKQAADNRVIAHSTEKLPGDITILLQNGSVQTIVRQFLGNVLQEGYADPNAPVKPPKQDF